MTTSEKLVCVVGGFAAFQAHMISQLPSLAAVLHETERRESAIVDATVAPKARKAA